MGMRNGSMSDRLYRVQEFAKLTGVTVRTLHHYDQLGLLTPSGRTDAGYRLYGSRDLGRLQQITTLKFLGFPLKQIKELLDQSAFDLTATLRLQRKILQERQGELKFALAALEKAEQVAVAGQTPDWQDLRKLIEVMKMQEQNKASQQQDNSWMERYYTPEQREIIRQRDTPERREKGQQAWLELFAEIETNLHEDPAGPKGAEFVRRWRALVLEFTGGDPGVLESLMRMYKDRANWPASFNPQRPFSVEVRAFMEKAWAAWKTKNT